MRFHVVSVVKNLLKINTPKHRPARKNVEQNYLSIKEITYIGKMDVYNMEVKNHHNYSVSGGFIIHNCVDALRYLVQGLWTKIKYFLPAGESEDE